MHIPPFFLVCTYITLNADKVNTLFLLFHWKPKGHTLFQGTPSVIYICANQQYYSHTSIHQTAFKSRGFQTNIQQKNTPSAISRKCAWEGASIFKRNRCRDLDTPSLILFLHNIRKRSWQFTYFLCNTIFTIFYFFRWCR